MAIRCRDIMQLPTLKDMQIVAGHNGLDRIIRWVHVVDIPEVTRWVHGGELVFITGVSIKANECVLSNTLKEMEAKNLAGLVINLGPYIRSIPQEVLNLANSLNFPIFTLPWDTKLVEVTEAICNSIILKQIEERSLSHLLEDVLFSNFNSTNNLVARASYHGFDLTKPCKLLILDIADFKAYSETYIGKINIKNGISMQEIKTHFTHTVLGVLVDYYKKSLFTLRNDSLILLLPWDEKRDMQNIDKIFSYIDDHISKHFPGLSLRIGYAECYDGLKDIRNSYNETEIALKVAKAAGLKDKLIRYKDLGIYRLIFRTEDYSELELFYQDTLETLIQYDKDHNSQLVETLDKFLSEDSNLTKAAEKLHIHKNTLKYRIKKIQEITGRNLKNSIDCETLKVSFIIRKFLNLSGNRV